MLRQVFKLLERLSNWLVLHDPPDTAREKILSEIYAATIGRSIAILITALLPLVYAGVVLWLTFSAIPRVLSPILDTITHSKVIRDTLSVVYGLVATGIAMMIARGSFYGVALKFEEDEGIESKKERERERKQREYELYMESVRLQNSFRNDKH